MGQRTAIIIQKIFVEETSKGQGYVIGATFGFYNQWGYGHFLFRDINALLQRIKLPTEKLHLSDYPDKSKYYQYYNINFGNITAPDCEIKNGEIDIVEETKKSLKEMFESHEKFNDVWGGSYPYMDFLDVYISKHIDEIKDKNLFKYLPDMKDFRDEKFCKKYFNRFENDDGGALITLYGGRDFRSDIKECRIIDGRDKYGQFVSPDYYIQQYISEERYREGKAFMKRNYKTFVKLIEEFQGCNIIKDF